MLTSQYSSIRLITHSVQWCKRTSTERWIKKGCSRGSPSAISIAVIPRDHWSLCETRQTSPMATVAVVTHPVVVRRRGILITGNYLRGHPIRGPDKRVSLPDGPIQLGRNTKIDCKKDSQSLRKLYKTHS